MGVLPREDLFDQLLTTGEYGRLDSGDESDSVGVLGYLCNECQRIAFTVPLERMYSRVGVGIECLPGGVLEPSQRLNRLRRSLQCKRSHHVCHQRKILGSLLGLSGKGCRELVDLQFSGGVERPHSSVARSLSIQQTLSLSTKMFNLLI